MSSIGASQFHSRVAGSNYPAISDSDMRKMTLYVPQYREQLLIMEKFNHISNIQSSKYKIFAQLERLKKSLIQNLLTGRIRI